MAAKIPTNWTERHRPQKLADYVWINSEQERQVKEWVNQGFIPDILLSGGPGCGKSSLARLLMKELKVDAGDFKYVNASKETGIEYLRSLSGFCETMASGRFRYVLLDECLDENTLVWILRNGKESKIIIKELDQKNDLVKSYNVKTNRIEWRPFELIDKDIQEVLEIEFENNEVIICTLTHKWYVEDLITNEIIEVNASELHKYNHILTPK